MELFQIKSRSLSAASYRDLLVFAVLQLDRACELVEEPVLITPECHSGYADNGHAAALASV